MALGQKKREKTTWKRYLSPETHLEVALCVSLKFLPNKSAQISMRQPSLPPLIPLVTRRRTTCVRTSTSFPPRGERKEGIKNRVERVPLSSGMSQTCRKISLPRGLPPPPLFRKGLGRRTARGRRNSIWCVPCSTGDPRLVYCWLLWHLLDL